MQFILGKLSDVDASFFFGICFSLRSRQSIGVNDIWRHCYEIQYA